MPKMPLTAGNKAKSMFDFPKLFLEKGGRARVALIEPDPFWEWVHVLRAPQIVNGRPVYEKFTDPKTHETKDVMKYDFVGRHICIGSPDVIDVKGTDVEGCPVCRESQLSDAVKPPERRFAMNVISYQLKHGSFAVAEPFQVELAVWAYGDNIVNKLIDFNEEWASQGGLQKHDLLLGPCENKQYQKFDINVAPDAQWLLDKDRQQLAASVYRNNRIEDLTVAVGRRLSREQVTEDLSRVLTRYNMAHGLNVGPQPDPSQVTKQLDLGSIMDNADSPQIGDPHIGGPIGEPSGDPNGEDRQPAVLDLDSLLDL